ncbi:MAG: hypothetical protein N2Z73_05045, partial [Endomicrobia bacterium]|nr:hypothetical protein [Endomicrobiia bacterium]
YYELQIATTVGFTTLTISTSGITSSAYTVTANILRQTTYYWRVRAKDGVGNTGSWSSIWSVSVDTTPPSVPSGLTATAGSNYIVLQWNQNSETDLKDYSIYKSTLSTLGYVFISTIAKNLNYYYDYDVVFNVTYYYRITASDIAGNESGYSNTAQCIILSAGQPSDVIPPSAVTDLTSVYITTAVVKLIWTVTGDDNSTGNIVNGRVHIQYTYDVTQANNPGFWRYADAQVKLSTTVSAKTKCEYILSSLLVSGTYYFRLWLADEVLNWSSISNGTTLWVFAQQPILPTPQLVSPQNFSQVNDLTPLLDWSDAGLQNINYILAVDDDPGFVEPLVVDNFLLTSSEFLFPFSLQNGTTYYWKVKCVDTQQNEGSWSEVWRFVVLTVTQDTTPPAVPTLLYPQDGQKVVSLSVKLDWSDVSDPSGVMYNLQISTNPFFISIITTTTLQSEFQLDNLKVNTTYYWRIQSVDGYDNKSQWSNTYRFVVVSTTSVDTIPPQRVNSLTAQPGYVVGSVILSWISPGDDGNQGVTFGEVRVQYSSTPLTVFNLSIAQVKISTTVIPGEYRFVEVTHLNMFTTYYFVMWIRDESNNWSLSSNISTCVPLSIIDTQPPVIGYLNKISSINILGNKVVIETEVIDDTGILEVVLYYKQKNASTFSIKKFYPSSLQPDRFIAEISPSSITLQGIEYYIKATDLSGKTVACGSILDPVRINVVQQVQSVVHRNSKVVLIDGNPYDGEVDVEFNNLEDQVSVEIEQIKPSDIEPLGPNNVGIDYTKNYGLPLAVYDFRPYTLTFKLPIKMTLLYLDPDNDGIISDMNCNSTGVEETEPISVYLYDGSKWLFLGGVKDTAKNTLTISTSRFGRYAIFVTTKNITDTLNNKKIVSPQIFTPETPLVFSPSVKEVEIYSLTGAKVYHIIQTQPLLPIMWTGYNEKGFQVESGVYIYKALTTTGKTENGIIIFAK